MAKQRTAAHPSDLEKALAERSSRMAGDDPDRLLDGLNYLRGHGGQDEE